MNNKEIQCKPTLSEQVAEITKRPQEEWSAEDTLNVLLNSLWIITLQLQGKMGKLNNKKKLKRVGEIQQALTHIPAIVTQCIIETHQENIQDKDNE